MTSASGKGSRTGLSAAVTSVLLLFSTVWVTQAQLATLPTPRLLTVMPMGGLAGSTVEVTLTGSDIDDASELRFSSPTITAKPKLGANGQAEPNKFLVTLPATTPHGIHDMRVLTRYGISTPRAFVVGGLPEVVRTKANNSQADALALEVGSVCNAYATAAAEDYYTFQAKKGQRVLVDCASTEIDSRLVKVLILADAEGRDLVVNRRGGFLDWTAPADGKFFIKVHSLTYEGGPEHFYRLTLTDGPRVEYLYPPVATTGSSAKLALYGRNTVGSADAKAVAEGVALTRAEVSVAVPAKPMLSAWAGSFPLPLLGGSLSGFSWIPGDSRALPQYVTLLTAPSPVAMEVEPNGQASQAQKITLPCDIAGQFYPAADVDTYEFTAKKGEVWWIEVTSQRLGLHTDPFVVVQSVTKDAKGVETLADVVEINDIANPIAGTPYDAGSADPLGKLTIKADGVYRLQVRDLFGGTRLEPRNVYRLQVRKAEPDFALVAWPFHAPNVNNDNSAPAEPQALWRGATMALQVGAVRKDGFDGEIELRAEGLPPGVTATGSKVPAGKAQGFLFLTAAEGAKAGLGEVRLIGRAQIDGKSVDREISLASVIWHVKDMRQDNPKARLVMQKLVSVSGSEIIPISIAPGEAKVYEAKAGESLTIPLKIAWRGEPNSALKLKALATGFEGVKEFDVALKATDATAVLDLAALKTAQGDYSVAFYGVGKGKYRAEVEKLAPLEDAQKKAEQGAKDAAAETTKLTEAAKKAAPADKAAADKAAKDAAAKQKIADAAKADAVKLVTAAKAKSAPKDYADIIVSEPVRISIKAADKPAAKK